MSCRSLVRATRGRTGSSLSTLQNGLSPCRLPPGQLSEQPRPLASSPASSPAHAPAGHRPWRCRSSLCSTTAAGLGRCPWSSTAVLQKGLEDLAGRHVRDPPLEWVAGCPLLCQLAAPLGAAVRVLHERDQRVLGLALSGLGDVDRPLRVDADELERRPRPAQRLPVVLLEALGLERQGDHGDVVREPTDQLVETGHREDQVLPAIPGELLGVLGRGGAVSLLQRSLLKQHDSI